MGKQINIKRNHISNCIIFNPSRKHHSNNFNQVHLPQPQLRSDKLNYYLKCLDYNLNYDFTYHYLNRFFNKNP